MNELELELKLPKDSIKCIFKTGSSMLLTNNRDEDYIIVYSPTESHNENFRFTYRGKTDYFIYSEDAYREILNFNIGPSYCSNIAVISLVICKPILNELNLQLDLFNNVEKYKDTLRYACEISLLNTNVIWEGHENYCSKNLWFVILGLMMIENNSYEVTPEMKEIAQKCHDGCLPKSWEDWVKERLYTDNK